jgi:hypothetical protein
MTEVELIREQEKAEGLRMATKAGKLLLSLTLVLMLAVGLTRPVGAASVNQGAFVRQSHSNVQVNSANISQRATVTRRVGPFFNR